MNSQFIHGNDTGSVNYDSHKYRLEVYNFVFVLIYNSHLKIDAPKAEGGKY